MHSANLLLPRYLICLRSRRASAVSTGAQVFSAPIVLHVLFRNDIGHYVGLLSYNYVTYVSTVHNDYPLKYVY